MLEWMLRGLRKGRITTRYPRGAEPRARRLSRPRRGPRHRPMPTEELASGAARPVQSASTTGGRSRSTAAAASCAASACRPRRSGSRSPTGTRRRRGHVRALVVGATIDPGRAARAATLGDQARALRRSIHVRHIDSRLGRRRGVGDPGAVEPVLRHPAPRVLPHHRAPARGRAARHRRRHRRRCARRWSAPGRSCPSPRRSSPSAPTPAPAGSRPRAARSPAVSTAVLPVDVYVPGSPPAPDRAPARTAARRRAAATPQAPRMTVVYRDRDDALLILARVRGAAAARASARRAARRAACCW